MEALAADGWYLALDKAFVTTPATTIPFLGLLVDLTNGCLRVSKAKATKLAALCEAILGGSGRLRRQVVTLRELQKVGGTLAFLGTAAPLAGMARWAIDAATSEAMRLPGRTVALRGALREQVAFWAEKAHVLPHSPALRQGLGEGLAVATDSAGEPFMGWGAVAWPGRVEAPPVEAWLAARAARCGDASKEAVSGFGKLVWPDRQGKASSAALELQGLRRALRWLHERAPGCLRNRVVTWYCDAQAAIGAVRKWRSPSVGVVAELKILFRFCEAQGCAVRPVWVARNLGWQPVADFLSRMAARSNSAEWRLPRAAYLGLCREVGFEPVVDLFAAPGGAHCDDFITLHPVQPGRRVDAFAAPWDGIRGYAFPPFSQAGRCLRQLASAKGARVLCVLPAEVPVPGNLRVIADHPLVVPLVDALNRPAPAPCPRPLRAVLLESPPADGPS
jgi:ribonuclease HI